MDFITRDQARRDIVTLNLPQIVLDIFDEKPLPKNLDIHFCAPYPIFALEPIGQAEYGDARMTPLWMSGGSTIVAYQHAPERRGYFRFDIESGEEEPIFLTWQQVLVEEFQFLWESEWTDEDLIEVAGWFNFKCIELLIGELSQLNLDPVADRNAWYREFLRKVQE